MLLVETLSEWDKNFFERFKDFRNEIHKDIKASLVEKLDDYEKFFGTNSLFKDDYSWTAFLVTQNDKIMAKAILSWRKNSHLGNLGFIDWINNEEAARLLINEVEKLARETSLLNIKTPVDLNFFIKYRIQTEGGSRPFFGEPVYPDYYHELFQKNGFRVINKWDTYKMNKVQNAKDYIRKVFIIKKKRKIHSGKIKVRYINMKKWDDELRIVFELFMESYKNMAEFEPISFGQFKLIYDDFKYIIQPRFAYIVEYEEKPVGFCINYPDPLKILKSIKSDRLNIIQKLILILRLKLNFNRLLVAYVGKIPGPNGEDIKGVQISVSKKLIPPGLFMKEVLVTYQGEDSPSRRPFDQATLIPWAKYVLYGKDLK